MICPPLDDAASATSDLESIRAESLRLEESVTQSAQNQFEQAKLWRGVNLVFGVPAAALAAVAGGTGLAGVAGRVPAAIMALISAGLAGALTTLNAGRRVTQAHSSANAYLGIQTNLRQFRTIDLAHLDFQQARERLNEFTVRTDEINETADIPSRLAYWLAQRNISKGRQTYEADRGKPSR
jgi:hypothetical protein